MFQTIRSIEWSEWSEWSIGRYRWWNLADNWILLHHSHFHHLSARKSWDFGSNNDQPHFKKMICPSLIQKHIDLNIKKVSTDIDWFMILKSNTHHLIRFLLVFLWNLVFYLLLTSIIQWLLMYGLTLIFCKKSTLNKWEHGIPVFERY